jgi:hypothetical protein
MFAATFSSGKIRGGATGVKFAAIALGAMGIAFTCFSDTASAQFSQRPGFYWRGPAGNGFNPITGSVHVPGQAVYKQSGQYQAIGNGYYQNPMTGNKYNPHTGSYLQGSRPGFSQVESRPNTYFRGPSGAGFNPITGSVHLPGQAVFKGSGTYQAIGGGYYRNPVTGNTYNPRTGTYLRNW